MAHTTQEPQNGCFCLLESVGYRPKIAVQIVPKCAFDFGRAFGAFGPFGVQLAAAFSSELVVLPANTGMVASPLLTQSAVSQDGSVLPSIGRDRLPECVFDVQRPTH
jgi:hypothetical protein